MSALNSESPEKELSNTPQREVSSFDWYRRWQAEMNRPLRVLHLGNIANNAFNNARIQRLYGIDAYVIAHENYHIMSTPEWEEARFEGDYGDPFVPDWTKVNLQGYERPNWFASGPLELCCELIESQINQRGRKTEELVSKLKARREAICLQGRRGWAMRLAARVRRKLLSELRSLNAGFSRSVPGQPARKDLDETRLLAIWKSANVSHESPLSFRDFKGYASRLGMLRGLFEQFDVVQGYSTDGAWPLLADRRYVAYEHGTLRALPFGENSLGRLTATVFMGAEHVFITNLDCIEPAERLGISADRFTPLPHAFNDRKLSDFRDLYCDLKPPNDRIVFFHPARQDWRDPDPSLTKGNDRLIRAFAKISRANPTATLRMIAWGRDLAASRNLVVSLGIEDKVHWLEPLQKQDLWKAYLSSHAVLDQFVLPSFGGVTFEALALGRRVVTNVDVAAAQRFFSKSPPVYSVSTEDEIAAVLEGVVKDRDDIAGIGKAGAEWIKTYHSADKIVDLQLSAYRPLLADRK
jgi:glycosyltransferase involved in cell wall biosynthesis